MIELSFIGGARTVTGSKHLVRTSRPAVLLDEAKLDAVVLSHAHIDHAGALPILVKGGSASGMSEAGRVLPHPAQDRRRVEEPGS